jgi:hypothetical protein
MPAHEVSFSVPSRRLGQEDIKFVVSVAGVRWGVLAVSKGALVWFARGKKDGYKLGWRKFDQVMKRNAARSERRT